MNLDELDGLIKRLDSYDQDRELRTLIADAFVELVNFEQDFENAVNTFAYHTNTFIVDCMSAAFCEYFKNRFSEKMQQNFFAFLGSQNIWGVVGVINVCTTLSFSNGTRLNQSESIVFNLSKTVNVPVFQA